MNPALSRQDEDEHAYRYAFLSVGELLSRPAPTWRLDTLIPFDGLACLYGPPGCGKSFLALSWALHIAANRPWLGRPVAWSPVVYVASEGAFGLGPRIAAWLNANELTADAIEGHFYVIGETVPLLEGSAVEAFTADIAATITGKPALIVFDTLARAMPGGDENGSKDMGLAIASADRIRRTTGAAGLLVHHTNKAGELERGSTALRAACDTMLRLRERDDGLALEVSKQRNAAPADPIALRLQPYTASAIITTASGALDTGDTLSRPERQALETLNAIALSEGSTSGEWLDSVPMGRGTYYRARKRLVDLGLVTRDQTSRRYTLTGKGIAAVSPRSQQVPNRSQGPSEVSGPRQEGLIRPSVGLPDSGRLPR